MNIPPEKLHELLTYCTEFAETMLKDSEEFYPFGAVLNSNLQVTTVGAHIGEEHPNPGELYQLLGKTFIQQARNCEIVGAAIACNVNIPSEYDPPVSDGVRVHLESEGYSRYIYVPYKIKSKGIFKKVNTVIFLEPIAVGIDASIFGSTKNA